METGERKGIERREERKGREGEMEGKQGKEGRKGLPPHWFVSKIAPC